MVIKISKETHPQYFTELYQSPLKDFWFDAWYRGMKASAFLKKHIFGIIEKNEEFFKDNPTYVEGALCGKRKIKDER